MLAEIHNVRRKAGSAGARDAAAELASALSFLGLSAQGFAQWRRLKERQILGEGDRIERLVAARSAARARKDWEESDRIRDELAAMGILLKDSKDGTTWEIAR
jgi:cysteinyl-tRNA synthetase